MADAVAARLAQFAARLRFEDLTRTAAHAARRSIVDAIGCAYGAFDAEPVRALRALASDIGAASPARSSARASAARPISPASQTPR